MFKKGVSIDEGRPQIAGLGTQFQKAGGSRLSPGESGACARIQEGKESHTPPGGEFLTNPGGGLDQKEKADL